MLTKIAISTGDPNGIGPEIILKLLQQLQPDDAAIILIGHPSVFSYYAASSGQIPYLQTAKSLDAISEPGFWLLNPDNDTIHPEPGKISGQAGAWSMKCVETGIRLCMDHHAHALVTAPISKEAIQLGGYNVPGHTEFLAQKTGTRDVLMMMVSESMRVALATAHLPLSQVAVTLTSQLLLKRLSTLHLSLISDFGITTPCIAVTGLNPHAGDGGVIGREEIDIIIPAIEQARHKGIDANGPYPADAFFARYTPGQYDAVLAMYHDQGLIPFKSTDNGCGVNFTAGLPIVRTSPDHGTAFDIAGKNLADPASMLAAYRLAFTLSKNRTKTQAEP
ncbi:MAG: 4-hydroxythreonine-4-phosphate dehydrogenase PdxA [Cyclonatronaceae bacterium]